MENISELLRNARRKMGLTLKDVSDKTGIGLTTINAWERGASLPREANRTKIAKCYGISEDRLTAPESPTDQIAATQRQFLAQYDSRVVMLHKQTWADADALIKKLGARDLHDLLDKLIALGKTQPLPR